MSIDEATLRRIIREELQQMFPERWPSGANPLSQHRGCSYCKGDHGGLPCPLLTPTAISSKSTEA